MFAAYNLIIIKCANQSFFIRAPSQSYPQLIAIYFRQSRITSNALPINNSSRPSMPSEYIYMMGHPIHMAPNKYDYPRYDLCRLSSRATSWPSFSPIRIVHQLGAQCAAHWAPQLRSSIVHPIVALAHIAQ